MLSVMPRARSTAWHRDDEVDAMYESLFRELSTYMLEDPRNIATCIELLFISKNLERIGDHTTNIAEKIHYMVHSQRINRMPQQAASMKPHVLIVEDEAPLQQLLAYNLERAGFTVDQAYDGEEAQTLIAERTPDLVIIDWMLPWMSGLELCRQLRRRPATANLPIIILTARGEEADRLQGLNTGADDYITKPFSIEELIARMRAVLRRVRPVFAEECSASPTWSWTLRPIVCSAARARSISARPSSACCGSSWKSRARVLERPAPGQCSGAATGGRAADGGCDRSGACAAR